MRSKLVQWEQLKTFFNSHNWKINNSLMTLEAGNLRIYYRDDYKAWRLKNTNAKGSYSFMDLTTIDFPFDDTEKKSVLALCSREYEG